MFIDSRQLQNSATIKTDIAIIGAGAAGITLANELSQIGLGIALLEAGGEQFDSRTQLLYDGQLTAHQNVSLAGSRLRYFGGTTNHWGGFCLPLEDIDFQDRSEIGSPGWPINLDLLTPYYIRAHEYCDLGTFDYDPITVGGFTPNELLSVDSKIIRTAVNRQSPPTRFGDKYRDSLRASTNVSVYLHANITELTQDAGGAITSAIGKTLTGVQFKVSARYYILCCGAIENARILLMSRSLTGSGIGNPYDLVGRYYMDHLAGGAGYISFQNYVLPSFYTKPQKSSDGIVAHYLTRLSKQALIENNLLNTSFWLTPIFEDPQKQKLALDSNRGLQGLKNIVKYSIGRPEAAHLSLSEEFCAFINNSEAMVESYIFPDEPTDTALLRFEAEQTATPDNRVSLTYEKDILGSNKVALNWAPSSSDWESIERSARIYGQEIGRSGIGRLRLEDKTGAPYWGFGTSWHQLGTTRMSTSQGTGVVDSNLKVFGVPNLFVAGGSVFPSAGRSNPTLTIVALTVRLADKIKAIAI